VDSSVAPRQERAPARRPDHVYGYLYEVGEVSAGRWIPPKGSVGAALVTSHPGGRWFGRRAISRFAATMQAAGGLWWTDTLLMDVRLLSVADRSLVAVAWASFVEESLP
jgi:hypothetical protein